MRTKSRFIAGIVAATLLTQLTACGSIFYPDRRGQIEGKIDPAVAAMYRAKMGTGIVFREFERVPASTSRSWEAELAAQVGDLPDAEDCLRRVREEFEGTRAFDE